MFQKYNVLSLLGSGGSSHVYLVEHIKLKSFRAVKRIKKEQNSPSSIYLEAGLLINLNHPGIPIIYDIEEDEHYLYIVEEYIEGESLHHFVHNNANISEKLVIHYALQLCDILDYLHNQVVKPILYLDLKPEHIILYGNQIKLVDFNLASFVPKGKKLFQNKGTKGFAAPEQYNNKICSAATDIFALGAILYFMLTKQIMPDYSKTNLFQQSYLAYPKLYSGNLKKIIQKATHLDPDLRYQDIKDLKHELQNNTKVNKKNWGQKTLLSKIIIAGSQKRIGTTHLAISLVCYLNHIGYEAFYEEKNNSHLLYSLVKYKKGFGVKKDFFQYGDFRVFNPANSASGIRIQDYGEDIDKYLVTKAEPAAENMVILVLGSREWEYESSLTSYKKLCYEKNFKIIANYYNKQISQEYSRIFQKIIYGFPYDADAFRLSKEKKRLFDKMLFSE